MEYIKEILQGNEDIDNNVLEQIIEILDEIETIDQQTYIVLNELKIFIKDYETFDTRDNIQEIISKIDIILNNYVNNTVSEISENSIIQESKDTENAETKERTDLDLIPENTIEINQDAVDIFDTVLMTEQNSNARLDLFFSDDRCKDINLTWIKDKTNPYSLDPYGLVIRKKSLNKTSNEYGWKYDSHNRPVHISINDTCTREENINNVLNIQYQKNRKAFEKKGIIFQIYSKYFPERLEKFKVNSN